MTQENFNTGSRRDSRDGKGRFDLLSPFVLIRDAKHLEHGAAHYGDRNWEKGQPLSRFIDSAMRHLVKYVAGLRDEDHLAAVRWNLACVMHFEELARLGNANAIDLLDLPQYLDPAMDGDAFVKAAGYTVESVGGITPEAIERAMQAHYAQQDGHGRIRRHECVEM